MFVQKNIGIGHLRLLLKLWLVVGWYILLNKVYKQLLNTTRCPITLIKCFVLRTSWDQTFECGGGACVPFPFLPFLSLSSFSYFPPCPLIPVSITSFAFPSPFPFPFLSLEWVRIWMGMLSVLRCSVSDASSRYRYRYRYLLAHLRPHSRIVDNIQWKLKTM